MPIPYFDFTKTPLQRRDNSPYQNLLSGTVGAYQQGKEFKNQQETQAQQKETRALSNEEQAMKNKIMKLYGKERERRELEGISARTAHEKRLASGGSGSQGMNSRNPYYGLPEQAKLMLLQNEIDQGFLPGSNGMVSLTPEEQQKYTELNALKMQKSTTDADTRRRTIFAENLVKAIDNTNLDDLTRYSGPPGQAQLKIEEAKDLAGAPSEEYLKYKEALSGVVLEAKELRQALGESITPYMSEQLQELTNPTGFLTSPTTAKRQIQKTRDIIRKQMNTFQSALKRPVGYGEQQEKNNKNKSSSVSVKKPLSELSQEELDAL